MFDLTNYRNIHFNDVDKLKLSTHTHTGTTVIAHTQTVTSSSEYISYNFWQDGGNYASNWANHSLCKTTFSKVDNTKMMPDTHLALGVCVCECVWNAVYSGVKWNWEQKIIKYQVQTFLHKIKKIINSNHLRNIVLLHLFHNIVQQYNIKTLWVVGLFVFVLFFLYKVEAAGGSSFTHLLLLILNIYIYIICTAHIDRVAWPFVLLLLQKHGVEPEMGAHTCALKDGSAWSVCVFVCLCVWERDISDKHEATQTFYSWECLDCPRQTCETKGGKKERKYYNKVPSDFHREYMRKYKEAAVDPSIHSFIQSSFRSNTPSVWTWMLLPWLATTVSI